MEGHRHDTPAPTPQSDSSQSKKFHSIIAPLADRGRNLSGEGFINYHVCILRRVVVIRVFFTLAQRVLLEGCDEGIGKCVEVLRLFLLANRAEIYHAANTVVSGSPMKVGD